VGYEDEEHLAWHIFNASGPSGPNKVLHYHSLITVLS
jgi:hypothetical protein